MKRASYREGVQWIAQNDNAGNGDRVEEITGYLSTLLLADLFGKPEADVAKDIARKRRALGLEVGE